jgi:hypothetical protein
MPADPYEALTHSLALAGMIGQRQNEDQLIVSFQSGPVLPNRGNSFWLSQKAGTWYLSTWSPRGYRIPAEQDLVALCSACMAVGTSAMYRVPPDIIARFELQVLNDAEYERLFTT